MLEAEIEQMPELRYDALMRVRRIRGSLVSKRDFVLNSVVSGKCWLWQRAKDKKGYARVGLLKKVVQAHALALEIWSGESPNGRNCLHKCDTPSCINPAHLFWGTQTDNNLDSVRKGRFNRPTGSEWHKRKRNL